MTRASRLFGAVCLAACLQTLAGAAEAQTEAALPQGWTITDEAPDQIQAKRIDGDLAQISAQTERPEAASYSAAEWQTIDAGVLAILAVSLEDFCPGITSAPVKAARRVSGSKQTSAGNDCAVISAHSGTRAVFGLSANTASGTGDADQILEALALRLLGAQPAKAARSSTPAASPALAGDARLKAALDSVKTEHRPTAFASSLSEWDPVAMSMAFQWWQLLPGGRAVSADCGVGAPARDCDTATWSQRGNTVSLSVDGDVLFDETIRPFPAGTRLDADVGNVGGGSVNNTSVLSSGQLRLTRNGDIAIGEWAGTSTDGGNYGAYTSFGSSVRGRYYIDGYLIAIEDADTGDVSVGTLFEKIEGRDRYLFLNGEQYWEE